MSIGQRIGGAFIALFVCAVGWTLFIAMAKAIIYAAYFWHPFKGIIFGG